MPQLKDGNAFDMMHIRQALIMLRDAFRGSFFSLTVIRAGDADYCLRHFFPIVIGCAVVLLVSIFKERKKDVLSFAAKLPLWVIPAAYAAVLIAAALFFSICLCGILFCEAEKIL